MDKQIKEMNKKRLGIIKDSQNKIMLLKKKKHNLIKDIIALEKKLGLSVDEKKPMKKTGFYFPNRDKKVQIKTYKKEEVQKLKNQQKPEIKLPIKVNKKIENVVNNLKKNIKEDVEKHISKANYEIKKIKELANEKNCKLGEGDVEF